MQFIHLIIYIVNTTKVIGKSESCGLAVCSRLEGRGNDPHPMLDLMNSFDNYFLKNL